MKIYMAIVLCSALFVSSCSSANKKSMEQQQLHQIATEYVRLGLEIGQYDTDFVDAYYGPDSLKPAPIKDTIFPKNRFLTSARDLGTRLAEIVSQSKNDTLVKRADWL